jgi:hypothetical protein
VSATLKTAGNQTITATDTVTSSVTGSSTTISVDGAAASVFTVSAPASVTAGGAFNVTVTAKDSFGNVASGYTGTVHFTSSDGGASLPSDYTFVAGDNGVHQVSVTLNTSGPQSITATDTVTGSITGNANTTVPSANPATHFSVSVPASATAGSSFSITVTALSAGNNTDTGYLGTVHFTSSDGAAILPTNYTFTGADNGAHTFTVTLKTGGNQTITTTDTTTGSINGTSGGITVNAAAASQFAIS